MLLPQVRVKPIWEPALIVAWSAVLAIVTVAHRTVTDPLSELFARTLEGSFVAVAVAVLSTGPQLAFEVTPLTW